MVAWSYRATVCTSPRTTGPTSAAALTRFYYSVLQTGAYKIGPHIWKQPNINWTHEQFQNRRTLTHMEADVAGALIAGSMQSAIPSMLGTSVHHRSNNGPFSL